MDNVIDLPVITKLDLDANKVAADLDNFDFSSIVVIGFTDDGEFYFSSSKADAGTVIYFLELAKKKLLDMCDEYGVEE